MKEIKNIVLELGNYSFDAFVIAKIVKKYLTEHAPNWTLSKTNQWEVVLNDYNKNTDYCYIEKAIVKELERMSQLYKDLQTLGLIKKE